MNLTVCLTPALPFGENDFRMSDFRHSDLSAASYQLCDHNPSSLYSHI